MEFVIAEIDNALSSKKRGVTKEFVGKKPRSDRGPSHGERGHTNVKVAFRSRAVAMAF